MKAIIYTLLIAVSMIGNTLNAQVNAYAQVTVIKNNTLLTVNNVNQTYGTFAINKKVIIYHTQGNVVSNLSNNSSYGQIGTIRNTGRFEVAVIKNITYTAGVPVSIELTSSLAFVPEINGNSRIQIISYPEFAGYVTTSKINALPWDGNVGGVVAFRVIGNLLLNHDISADGAGFRGGLTSIDANDACNNSTYRINDSKYAEKGEGIYRTTSNTNKYAMGRLSNGAGGANPHNAGGGGGGNFSAGGSGGFGWQCVSGSDGLGGGSLSNQIISDVTIAYLGGGGGGGHQNNGSASDGANGGGLIIIEADSVIVNAGNIHISANGLTAKNTGGKDGAGGGGAGGSVVLKVKGFRLPQANVTSLTISANGGNGGNAVSVDSHGGGGGGGTGLLKYIDANVENITGIAIAVNPGAPGVDNNTANPRISATAGINTPGIIGYGGNVNLPVEMLEQKVKCTSTGAVITWATATEVNNDYFQIEKSLDLKEWKFVNVVKGAGNSNSVVNYELKDENTGENVTYYRVKQVDYDGKYEYFDVLSILCKLGNSSLEIIGLNATDNNLNVYVKTDGFEPVKASLYDMNGKVIATSEIARPEEGANFVQFVTNVVNGIYIVVIEQNKTRVSKKVMIGKN